MLQGSQAPLARPSDKGSVQVNTIEKPDSVISDRGRGISVSGISIKMYNLGGGVVF
jgi:hypothetical protein